MAAQAAYITLLEGCAQQPALKPHHPKGVARFTCGPLGPTTLPTRALLNSPGGGEEKSLSSHGCRNLPSGT